MIAVFLRLFNMSITAGWIVLAVIFLRLLLKNMPKQFTCMLWGLVGLRLIFPFSIKSIFSLIPSAETVPVTLTPGALPEINSGISTIDRIANPAATYSFTYLSTGILSANPHISSGAEALNLILRGAVLIWLVGVFLMLFYLIFSYLRLHRKMRTAVRLDTDSLQDGSPAGNGLCRRSEHNIWQSEFVDSPFILGLVNPRIYIPFHLDKEVLSHVLAHENAHLARKDHLIKAFAFLLLSVYWFHPLIWAAYFLLCRDIELACDERVIRNMEDEQRKNYLLALIGYNREENRRKSPALACPLAFGELDIKERIIRAKNWKKPAFALVLLTLIVCVIAAVCLLTDPKEKLLTAPEPFGHPYQVEAVTYAAPQYDFSFTPETAPHYILTSDYQLMESTDTPLGVEYRADGYWTLCGGAEEIKLTKKELENYINVNGEPISPDFSASALVKENKITWIVNRKQNNQIFYYIMLQKNGDVYLTYGYEAEENPSIRWIFKLSAMEEETLSPETLYSYRTKYIGDNSAVGNIIYNLIFPEDMTYQQFALQTSTEPYEVTITFALSEEDKERYAYEAPERQQEINLLRKNACIMFSLIENAGIINFKLVDETDETKRPLTFVYTRQWAEFETSCNLWKESESKERFEILLINLQEKFHAAINVPQTNAKDIAVDEKCPMTITHESADILYYEEEAPYINDILTNNTDRTIIETQYCILAYNKNGSPLKLYWNFLDSGAESSFENIVRSKENIFPNQTEEYYGGWSLYDDEIMRDLPKAGNGETDQIAYVLFCLKQVIFEDGIIWNNPDYEDWFQTYAGKDASVDELQNYYPHEYKIELD